MIPLCCVTEEYDKKNRKNYKKRLKGAPGFEPGTSRSAVECSTTELYPQLLNSTAEISSSFQY